MAFKSSGFRDLIDKHLTCVGSIENGFQVHSSLTKAIIEARSITGRNILDGVPIETEKEKLGWWSGAVIYLTILDQIGSIYRDNSVTRRLGRDNEIIKALDYFAQSLGVDEIFAIYGLRCAFHHDFSLINIGRGNNPIHHNFLLHQEDEGEIVVVPTTHWDGILANLGQGNRTTINLKRLGDLVEDIYRHLNTLHSNGNLALALEQGEDELQRRYFLMYRHQ